MPDPLTPGDGQDLLARYRRAREKRDPDSMMELYADDATVRPDPFGPELEGANAVRRHWNEVAATQVNVDLDAERIWAVARTVLASWHAAYTVAATAERIRLRGFTTFDLDGEGRIARQRDWTHARSVGRDTSHKLEPAHEGGTDG